MLPKLLSTLKNTFDFRRINNINTYNNRLLGLYDDFIDFWIGEKGYKSVINENEFEDFIKNSLIEENKFIRSIKRNVYQSDVFIYSMIKNRFINDVKFENLYNFFGNSEKIKEYSLSISKRYIAICKDFFIGLQEFYNENPEFHNILDRYHISHIDNLFKDYFRWDVNVFLYSDYSRRYLYLRLIKDFFDNSYIKITSEENEIIRTKLQYYINNEDSILGNLVSNTRLKLYRYNELKMPDYLRFTSILNEEQALLLSSYLIEQGFIEPTESIKSYEAFFMGRLLIVNTSKQMYSDNSNEVSVSIKVKSKKLGYVAFVLDYLWRNDYLQCKNLWKILERYRYFTNHNGKIVNRNDFARASKDKKFSRVLLDRKGINNAKIENLLEFLKKNFPEKDLNVIFCKME
ncbi:MAG: hypothetical protein RBT49_01935 [Bacteroidales bacterium]|jgi:hypothetical protein|nr:hypothetical protein [Bacteroidales bacterium]